MNEREQKIAEVLDLSKPVSDCPECGGLGEIRSLGSRRKCECLYIRLKTLKRELDRRDEENRKLREERDAAVEGYQQQVKYAGELMTKLVSAQQERNMYKSSSEVFYERLKIRDELLEQLHAQIKYYFGGDGGLAKLQDGVNKLLQERQKLIEGLRWYAEADYDHKIMTDYYEDDGELFYGTELDLDRGQRARNILREIGGDGGMTKVCKRHADDLIGDKIDEKCPKCGANMLENKVGDKWCSLVGCDYSINAPEGAES